MVKILNCFKVTIQRLQKHGVGAILDYAVEEELSEEKAKDLEMSSCQPGTEIAQDEGNVVVDAFSVPNLFVVDNSLLLCAL